MRKLLSFFVPLFMFISCCQCNRYDKNNLKPLEGTVWCLTQWQGREVDFKDSYRFSLSSGDAHFSAKGDCNSIGGYYSVEFDENSKERSGKIAFGEIFLTRMACPEGSREQEFLDLLESELTFSREGAFLYFFVDSTMVAVFEARESQQ